MAEKSYSDIAVKGSWVGRSNSLWSNAAIGLGLGAVVGLIAPFFPMIAAAPLPTTTLILDSLAIFSAVGMGIGFGAGLATGTSAGAVASIAEEQERREKIHARSIERKLHLPAGSIAEAEASSAELKQQKSLTAKVKDGFDSYFNIKVGAAFTLAGIVGGLVMAAAYIALGGLDGGIGADVPALGHILGEATAKSAGAVTAYFAGVMGAFGATWAVNVPKLAEDLTRIVGGFSSGKSLSTQWGRKPEHALEAEKTVVPASELDQAHVTMRKYESFQELIAAKGAGSPDLLAKR